MRNKLMIATAALALFAGTSVALAQQESPRGAPAEKMAPKSGSAPSRALGPIQNNGAIHDGAAEKVEPNRAQAQQNREPNRGRSETTGQAPSERRDQGRDTERRGVMWGER